MIEAGLNLIASKKLNLDCGRNIKQGWINLDRSNLSHLRG